MQTKFYRISSPDYHYDEDFVNYAPTLAKARKAAANNYVYGTRIVIEKIVTADLPPAELACCLILQEGYAVSIEEVANYVSRT